MALVRWRSASSRTVCLAATMVSMCAGSAAAMQAAADYPVTLDAAAFLETATTKVASTVTIHVERLMSENARKRVTDALRYSGYSNFLNALRLLPAVGWIEVSGRKVEIRYAHEVVDEAGRRLVLVADRPLFFLGGDPARSRAGYELTMIELRAEANERATGTMSGAARVKPGGEGRVLLDDYAQAPVQLEARRRSLKLP
jgi:hypothetical protein